MLATTIDGSLLLLYEEADDEESKLFKLGKNGYVTVPANTEGRVAIPELEAGIRDGWVRFWFRDDLVPLPGDLLKERDAANQRAEAAEAELARLRDELARTKGQA